jgi:hypothetical protein
MKVNYSIHEYESEFFEDVLDGFGALRLFRARREQHHDPNDPRVLAGQITYWDAEGGFSIETFSTDIPLVVLEQFITEAKEVILHDPFKQK